MTQPQQTQNLLSVLGNAHSRLFPHADSSQVGAGAGVGQDHQDDGADAIANKVRLLRTVLDGWLEGLHAESAKDGAHGEWAHARSSVEWALTEVARSRSQVARPRRTK